MRTKKTMACGAAVFVFLGFFSFAASAIEPQHQVAGSYGGSRLYAHDSLIISPKGKINLYSQTSTASSSDASNVIKKDSLCRSITNTSNNDYFVPWRSALVTPGPSSVNEWLSFITAASSGSISGVTLGSCCYPRINPNKPCGVVYHLGKRLAGAIPSVNPGNSDSSAELQNYGAEGDVSYDVVGYNRKQTWVCDAGEWIYTADEGGCFKDGMCNTYDPATNPTGYNGASVNSIPSSGLDTKLCNGVVPTSYNGSKFPQPDSTGNPPPYGTGGWTWQCPGQQGGSSEVCHANYAGGPMNAVCGYANLRTYATAPTNPNLCYVGTGSAVTGPNQSNKWVWSCAGVNGGNNANCTAYYASASSAACGAYASGGSPYGLLSFETVGGKPVANLCSVGTLSGSVSGAGTLASPWAWSCYNAANGTTANCSNTYTKAGICGATDGANVPSAPNKNMCAQGRWYNKETGGVVNSVVWDAGSKKWTWSCLGHNQVTGAVQNASCSAQSCAVCSGSSVEDIETPVGGTYNACAFANGLGTLKYTQTSVRQASPNDVLVDFTFGGTGSGSFTARTSVAEGYCAPCYKKPTSMSAGVIRLNACTSLTGHPFPATLVPH